MWESVLRSAPAPVELALSDGSLVVLHPFPVKSRYSVGDPLARLESVADDPYVHIGLGHGHITTVTFGAHEGDIRLPIDPSHVDRVGLDYLALGHWHGTRLITTGGGTRIAYSGTHEQTNYGEGDAGNVLIVSIAAKGAPPEIRAVHVGQLRWEQRALTFAGDGSIDRLRQILANQDVDFVELTLEGELPNRLYADYRDVLSQNGGFKHLRVNDSALRWVADAEEALPPLSDASLAEIQRRLWERLATSGNEAEIAREAEDLFGRYVREATQ